MKTLFPKMVLNDMSCDYACYRGIKLLDLLDQKEFVLIELLFQAYIANIECLLD